MKNMKTAYLVVVSSILFAGCTNFSQWNDKDRYEQITGIDKHSSYPIMRREYFERINLLELVDPEHQSAKDFKVAWNEAVTKTEKYRADKQNNALSNDAPVTRNIPTDLNEFGIKYDLALARFRQRKDITDDEKRHRRNSIQERIIATSMSRCNVFKTFLRRDQADQNFMLGSLTTSTGILGAVLPGATASHNLAGAAGLFSGIRSEYNQAYYSNLAAHVIVRGIETKQELVYNRIQREGQSKSIDIYPLEAAIKDAIYWDGLCSVVVGLDQAAASIDATNEPGLAAATRTMLRAKIAKEALDLPREKLLESGMLEKIGLAGSKLDMSLVGSSLDTPENAPINLFKFTSRMTESLDAAVASAGKNIEQALNDKQNSMIVELRKKAAEQSASSESADKELAKETEATAKQIEAVSKTAGSVEKAAIATLKEKILIPMKLDSCYLTEAAPSVQRWMDAKRELDGATTDEQKITASNNVKTAELALQEVQNKLSKKGDLVKLDINTYVNERLDAIRKVLIADPKSLKEPESLIIEAAPSASNNQSCKVPSE